MPALGFPRAPPCVLGSLKLHPAELLEFQLLGTTVSRVGFQRRGIKGGVRISAHVLRYYFRPESKPDYPPNLSILISGGKENNCDSLSNGE